MGVACSRLGGATIVFAFTVGSSYAQSSTSASAGVQDETDSAQTANVPTHDMSGMAREGSGTSWLPEQSPMYMVHRQKGPWMLMGHENVFVQFLHESGDRGDDQAGSINWAMGMAERS